MRWTGSREEASFEQMLSMNNCILKYITESPTKWNSYPIVIPWCLLTYRMCILEYFSKLCNSDLPGAQVFETLINFSGKSDEVSSIGYAGMAGLLRMSTSHDDPPTSLSAQFAAIVHHPFVDVEKSVNTGTLEKKQYNHAWSIEHA